jgi:hypothetical protein
LLAEKVLGEIGPKIAGMDLAHGLHHLKPTRRMPGATIEK